MRLRIFVSDEEDLATLLRTLRRFGATRVGKIRAAPITLNATHQVEANLDDQSAADLQKIFGVSRCIFIDENYPALEKDLATAATEKRELCIPHFMMPWFEALAPHLPDLSCEVVRDGVVSPATHHLILRGSEETILKIERLIEESERLQPRRLF